MQGDSRVQNLQRGFPEGRMSLDELAEWDAAFDRLAHESADKAMGFPERHPVGHEPFSQVDRGEPGPAGCGLHPVMVERRRAQEAVEPDQGEHDLVQGIEERLLVLLEITVVRKRQAFRAL